MSMRVLMIAPPGAGKGTQGALIAAHFDILHIATGELLRDHVARRTALGQAVQKYLDRGELVPDQIVLDMLREAMVAAKATGGGFVLDGGPRNKPTAPRAATPPRSPNRPGGRVRRDRPPRRHTRLSGRVHRRSRAVVGIEARHRGRPVDTPAHRSRQRVRTRRS